VRNMNLGQSPFGWERRIQHGRLGMELMRPLHPVHGDISFFAGWKMVMILMWLPLAAALVLIFKPTLNPTWLQIVVFAIAIWGAYLIRALSLALLGMISFWTTRVSAIYNLFFALELILSGRLVPMTFMPLWVQKAAYFFPFQSSFYFPINALVGQPTPIELFSGLLFQLFWIAGGVLLLNVVWHFGIRRFSSVGN